MRTFRLKTALLAVMGVALALGLWTNWDRIPGTLRFDSQGAPHGTGTKSYFYPTGQLKCDEFYRRGLVEVITWYKPDGTFIATTTYTPQNGGPGYQVRDDGSIRSKMYFKYSALDNVYIADGDATYYDRDGNVVQVVRYVDGVAMEKITAPP